MKKISLLLVIAFLFVHHYADAQNISIKPIRQTGNPASILLVAISNGTLYSIDTGGKLIHIHIISGKNRV